MAAPVILALDLATNIGFAYGTPGVRPKFGTHRLPSTDKDIGLFAHKFDIWISDMITMHNPERVVFETSVLPKNTTLITLRKLTGLTWHTELVCRRRQVICNEVNVSTIKKFWAGSGFATKQDMVAAARRHRFKVSSGPNGEDEADALGLWHYTTERLHPGMNSWMSLGDLGGAQ